MMNPFLNLYFFLVLGHSRDGRGKPFFIKLYFFLYKKSDRRKLLFRLRKKQF